MADGTKKTPDEFLAQVEAGKIPLELTVQMKWNIAETISRIRENGIELGAGDYVDINDLKYICQAASYLMLYAQQIEAERDALVKYLTDSHWAACDICKHDIDGSGTEGCKHIRENGIPCFEWRGVQKED